jgi:excisionase family DNA binding protein
MPATADRVVMRSRATAIGLAVVVGSGGMVGVRARVAPGGEPVKATPSGPPAAGPVGLALTEPPPSAKAAATSAGKSLPKFSARSYPHMPAPLLTNVYSIRHPIRLEAFLCDPSPPSLHDITTHADERLWRRARGIGENASAFTPLIDAKAAGQLLGAPHTWLLAQARAGRIPHHRLGHYVRFSAADLKQWLQDTRIGDGRRAGWNDGRR